MISTLIAIQGCLGKNLVIQTLPDPCEPTYEFKKVESMWVLQGEDTIKYVEFILCVQRNQARIEALKN